MHLIAHNRIPSKINCQCVSSCINVHCKTLHWILCTLYYYKIHITHCPILHKINCQTVSSCIEVHCKTIHWLLWISIYCKSAYFLLHIAHSPILSKIICRNVSLSTIVHTGALCCILCNLYIAFHIVCAIWLIVTKCTINRKTHLSEMYWILHIDHDRCTPVYSTLKTKYCKSVTLSWHHSKTLSVMVLIIVLVLVMVQVVVMVIVMVLVMPKVDR